MAIDLCLEGAGWVIHAIDGGAPDVLAALRRLTPFPRATPLDRAAQTRRVAAQLPIDQANAIWLVDVCGYSYAAAAVATNTDLEVIAERVRVGRNVIRSEVYGEPRPCAEER